jgi:aldose 1-epimerase
MMQTGDAGTTQNLGPAPDGGDVLRATIGQDGLTVCVLSFGAILQEVWREDCAHSLVLGFDDVTAYFRNPSYVGTVVGRYGNRIKAGRFYIDDIAYQLDLNEAGRTHLHGGQGGVSNRNWTLESVSKTTAVFSIRLRDLEMGYPGNLDVTLTYEVLRHQRLRLHIQARTDQPTVVNLVPHYYFKLDQSPTISEHILQVFADQYLPADPDLIPTGAPCTTLGTAYDFSRPTPLAALNGCKLIDHNYCFPEGQDGTENPLRSLAVLSSTRSGRSVEIASTKPGLQVYTGEALGASPSGTFQPFGGIALEPQFWPNSPNMKDYPSTQIDSAVDYDHVHQFGFK